MAIIALAHRQILTLNETHVFSPNFVNEARLGFNRIAIAFTPNAWLNPASLPYRRRRKRADRYSADHGHRPRFELRWTFGFPQGRTDTYFVFSDAATVLKGKHTIKFGGEYPPLHRQQLCLRHRHHDICQYRGELRERYGDGFSINPQTVSSRIFINAQGYFIQDNYKLTPRLTLEGGFRFEWNGTPTEGANRLIIFDPSKPWLVQTRTNGYGGIYKQNYNYEPRVGFALDVFGNRTRCYAGDMLT